MTNVYEVQADKFNEKLAEALKKLDEFDMPEWAGFVKTSNAKARPPYEEDWWHKRAASILRQVYIKGVIGVNRLKNRYGGRKIRGSKPEESRKGSGKIIRIILQQAEKAGFLMKAEGKRKGRQLTKKGLEFMNKISETIVSEHYQKPQKLKISDGYQNHKIPQKGILGPENSERIFLDSERILKSKKISEVAEEIKEK